MTGCVDKLTLSSTESHLTMDCVGIQFPEWARNDVLPTREMSSAEDKRVLDFLDRMKAKHGAKKSFLTSGRQMSAHHH